MSRSGDNLVLYLLLGSIVYLFFKRWISFRSMLRKPKASLLSKEGFVAKGEVPELLREQGFDVISSKEKIELGIDVNQEQYESRIYIDYIARKEQLIYLVIVAKERKPVRMSGASLRDAFLCHYLLCRPEGILYVNREKASIKVIHFDVPDFEEPKKDWVYPVYSLFFGVTLGMVIAWLMLK